MNQPKVAVLAAAGHGRRIHPRRRAVPKVMLEVAGKPLLIRNLELVRDELNVKDFIVVIGHLGDQVREALGDGSAWGVRVRFVENEHVDGGLGTILSAIQPILNERFYLILGDELYLNSNHSELRDVADDCIAACALWKCQDERLSERRPNRRADGETVEGRCPRVGDRDVCVFAGDLRFRNAPRKG